ncbi:hypothetical protein [Falsiroseomonas stagni]|uniref:Uncharacterized protein n=1 Tax=Falsiroseomonas stagni DSM 19981 TaxID=1123062 RepID=A0A1I4FG18_9PROT|nr:hypothetical protein [Falsiroseomonas stagni]SFL16393.1 hypothetical protein SAMN02745775_1318 [Falsiroseomonas stagni DSM 19981]
MPARLSVPMFCAILGAAGAPTARAEVLAVITSDGRCTLREAADGTLTATAAVLGADAHELHAFARRLLADAAAMRMAAARERVPAFGDWAYGWVQSYVTSYRVLSHGAIGAAQSLAGRGEWPRLSTIADEMAAPVREEFRSRVLAPSLEGGGFEADLGHVGHVLDGAWRRRLDGASAVLSALPGPSVATGSGGTPSTILVDFRAAAAQLTPTILASTTADPLSLVAQEGADSATVFMRSIRPMAARLGAVVMRIGEVGSIVTAGGAFGFALGGTPGTAIGIAGGVSASWAIDWVFNRVDASMNRVAFEAQALEAITRAELRMAEAGTAAAASALAARMLALVPGAGGCP